MFRFLHSADLHLGKRFGNFPEDLRGRLRDARHGAISRLAAEARAGGASSILLAGDIFDSGTPSPEIRRQAIAEMGHHTGLAWVLLPGNHDSLQETPLWEALRDEPPPNVVLATEAKPVELAATVWLLPAPSTTRRPGRDLTEWMDGAGTPEGAIRIGLAHGPIQSFSEDAAASNVIAPDRADRAGLDYLALGDWHGRIAVNSRTHYSGTPEIDRFKHDAPGQALMVSLAGHGAKPDITQVETGSFAWQVLPLPLLSEEDGAAALAALLPPASQRRQTLLKVAASGRLRLASRTALAKAAARVAPEFAYFELAEQDLATDCESDDLDIIDRAGALRVAAETLLAESADPARPLAEREIARGALTRLFSYAEAIGS